MKFRFKDEPKMQEGDSRIIRKFLLLPLRLDNEIRWLESAEIYQKATRFVDTTIGYRWENKFFYNCYDCLECRFNKDGCVIKRG